MFCHYLAMASGAVRKLFDFLLVHYMPLLIDRFCAQDSLKDPSIVNHQSKQLKG